MAKRNEPKGKTRIHEGPHGTAINVHEGANHTLYWHRASDIGQEDARGLVSLHYPVGWVSDEEDRWQLWFSGNPARRDAVLSDYPYFWDFIEYADSGSRKKSAPLDAVSPVTLSPPMPNWTPKEARLATQRETETEQASTKARRAKHKLEGWQLGVRTIQNVAPPNFRATMDEAGRMKIELEPYSTARMLLRIIEQAMIHIPKTTIKDSDLEPLLKVAEFMGAMDYENFGLASSMCAGRYVKAFALAVPKPYRSLILPSFAGSAKDELLRLAPEAQEPVADPIAITRWIADGPDDGLISIEQVAIDIDNDKYATGASTPRRLADKLARLSIPVQTHAVLGRCIFLSDYRTHRTTLLHRTYRKRPK